MAPGRSLPSVLAVAAHFRAGLGPLPAAAGDDDVEVEVINVELDEEEILLSEADLLLD